MTAFFVIAARKAYLAFREGRLSASPLEWVRLLRQLAAELRTPGVPSAIAAAAAPLTSGTTVPAVDDEAQRMALAAFLAGHQRFSFAAPQPQVSVLIAVHNRADLTLRCLRSLAETAVPLQVVIVDNASTDATARLLQRIDGAVVLRNTENLGFLGAVNQAAARASGELLLLLNNDAEPLPGSLEAAVETLQSSASIGAVVGKLVHWNGRLQEAGSILWRDGTCQGYGRGDDPLAPPFMFRRDVAFGSAAFLLTRRDTFRALGGFDPRYQPAYYEDTDFCLRLWQTGLRVVYEPRAVVRHAEFGSAGSPEAAVTLQTERRALFVARHQVWLQQHAPTAGTALLRARSRHDGQHILFVEDRIPHEKLGSGYPRALAMIRAALDLGHHVTLYPLLFPVESWEEAYADMPREAELWIGGGAAGLPALMHTRGAAYDAIIISRPHNMRLARTVLPARERRPAVIYDAEALFALRDVGRQRLHGMSVTDEAADRLVEDEVALARECDLVLAVSTAEGRRFVDRGCPHVMVLGHASNAQPTLTAFSARSTLLFVGAFVDAASPNTDSVRWFVREVLPLLQSRLGDNARFVVAGRDPTRALAGLSHPSVELLGPVDDLRPLFEEARIFVSPTRYGAGLSAKAHQAAASGVPLVTSSLVATQLGWDDGIDLLVADAAERFAEQCARLYTDEALWTRLRASALARATDECSPAGFRATLAQALTAAQEVRESGETTSGVGVQSESGSK